MLQPFALAVNLHILNFSVTMTAVFETHGHKACWEGFAGTITYLALYLP